MVFVIEVSNDANGSKVPRNGKILLFCFLDLLRLFLYPTFSDSILLKMKRKEHSTWKNTAHRLHIISLFFNLKHI